MKVVLPCLLALGAFAGWVWLTGPGTTILTALVGLGISAFVLLGTARLLNGKRGASETGDTRP